MTKTIFKLQSSSSDLTKIYRYMKNSHYLNKINLIWIGIIKEENNKLNNY